MNSDDATRRMPSLENLRDDLANAPWTHELRPVFEPIPHPRVSDRLGRGFYGEDIMARAVAARGEIILDYGSGIEDSNKGGPDLVTLAEDERGLVVRLYDNKALTTRKNISDVSALDQNLEANVAALQAEWKGIVDDPSRTDAERRLFAAALDAVNDETAKRIDLVLANANGRVEGVTDRIAAKGMILEDFAGNLEKDAELERTMSPFDPRAEYLSEPLLRTDAEKRLFTAALNAANDETTRRMDPVLANANGRAEDASNQIAAEGTILADSSGSLEKSIEIDRIMSPFDPRSQRISDLNQSESISGGLLPRSKLQ